MPEHRETHMDLAALRRDADKVWALPQELRPPPYVYKRAWGVQVTREGRGMHSNGVDTISVQTVSSVGGRHPPRRCFAVSSTWQKAMSSALTRTDVATQSKFSRTCSHSGLRVQGMCCIKSKADSSVVLNLAENKLPCIIAVPLISEGLGATRLRY